MWECFNISSIFPHYRQPFGILSNIVYCVDFYTYAVNDYITVLSRLNIFSYEFLSIFSLFMPPMMEFVHNNLMTQISFLIYFS